MPEQSPLNGTLENISILVTRPLAQAEPLINKLKQAGAIVFHQPAIAIEVLSDHSQQPIIQNIHDYDWLIFISKNAVTYGLDLIEQTHKLSNSQQIAAIGKATLKALAERGYKDITSPEINFDSEALLNSAAFSASAIANKKLLIIRGGKGREHLKQVFETRGAIVTYLDVYSRSKPDLILTRDDFKQSQIITVSSQQGLENLLSMLDQKTAKSLFDKILIVPSQRCYKKARELGFNQVETAANATDDAMLNCILDTMSSYNQTLNPKPAGSR